MEFLNAIGGNALALLGRVSSEARLEKTVLNHVSLHMFPNQLATQQSGRKALNRLFDKSLCPEDLLLLAAADRNGRNNAGEIDETEIFLRNALASYQETISRPGVTGADLVAAGFRPCPAFRDALTYANRLQLAGVEKKEALPQTLGFLRRLTDPRD